MGIEMKKFFLAIVSLFAMSLACFSSEIAGTKKFVFQSCEIVCIQDTPSKMPQSLFFDTANSGYKQVESAYDASVNVFLVKKGGKSFLVDAGNEQGRGSLREKLRKLDVPAESITDIFITHIHPDHVGGLRWDNKPLFPNATIHIASKEFEAWQKDSKRASLSKFILPYGNKIRLFQYEETLSFGMIPMKRGGHTPGHTIFRMPLGGEKEALFVGDIVHGVALQFPHPTFCAKFDAAPQEAVKSRIQTLQMKGVFFGAHFPFPGVSQGGIVLKGEPDWSFSYSAGVSDVKTAK